MEWIILHIVAIMSTAVFQMIKLDGRRDVGGTSAADAAAKTNVDTKYRNKKTSLYCVVLGQRSFAVVHYTKTEGSIVRELSGRNLKMQRTWILGFGYRVRFGHKLSLMGYKEYFRNIY